MRSLSINVKKDSQENVYQGSKKNENKGQEEINMRSLSKNVSIECFPPMNEMKTFLKDFSVPYISWFFRFDIFVSFSWFAGFTYGHTLFALMKQIPQTIDEILLVLLHTFPYTKNDYVIQNSKIPGYQSHHTRNVIIHPQENCSVDFSTKNKDNL